MDYLGIVTNQTLLLLNEIRVARTRLHKKKELTERIDFSMWMLVLVRTEGIKKSASSGTSVLSCSS
jgi:hypothetical protein